MSTLAIVYSRACLGITAPLVTVETHLANGLPAFSIVGLPETAVKESRDRVRSALINAQFEFPARRIIVNLAPADLPKDGGRFDLPIALGILAASEQIPEQLLNEYEFSGELALSGELRPIQGALPLALATVKAGRKLILPTFNATEAACIGDKLTVFPAAHLLEVCAHLAGSKQLTPQIYSLPNPADEPTHLDFQDVYGQTHAKRAFEIAAAGNHSLLMIGPPGTGKTMLASRMPSILPALTDEEAIEVAAILSISSRSFNYQHYRQRPFRAPHHTASTIALVGGGNPPRPGEISRAHGGVLFLDELPEFNRHVLESLREPLESGAITISRAARQAEFPARFQLIAAMNPCPCGHAGNPSGNCRCSSEQVQRYRARLSGPLLDRIDMHLEVLPLPQKALQATENRENSAQIRVRVENARAKQLQRTGKVNSVLHGKELEQYCQLAAADKELLDMATFKMGLSARAHHRILRVARTIADLAGCAAIHSQHLSEALSYRKLERMRN